jgi:hypothetical protein
MTVPLSAKPKTNEIKRNIFSADQGELRDNEVAKNKKLAVTGGFFCTCYSCLQ